MWTNEPSLKSFNLAALLFPTIWCIEHRSWELVLLLLPKALIASSALYFQKWYLVILVFAYSFAHSCYISIIADSIAWNSGIYRDSDAFYIARKEKYSNYILAFVMVAISGTILTSVISDYIIHIRLMKKARYTACMEQLDHVKSGIESYITKKKINSLEGITGPDDMCHYVLPGFENASQCRGMIKNRIDKVCLPETFSFKALNGRNYEIRARSAEEKQCRICFTESTATPERYRYCTPDAKFNCVHKK